MSAEVSGGFRGRTGPTGWVTRWVLATAVGQALVTGTVRLVLAALMGAALGGLAVWLVLCRRPARPRAGRPARPGYRTAPAAGAARRAATRVRRDGTRVRRDATVPNPAYRGRRFSPAAARYPSVASGRVTAPVRRTGPVGSDLRASGRVPGDGARRSD
jgi:hypothetical protein